jgi:DNA-binding beta-propeller fold protein YncE
VCDGGSEPRVKRYDGDTGAFIDAFTQVFPDGCRGLAFEPDGDLYGATGGKIFRVDGNTGAFIDYFVDLGLGELATGFSFGPDGNFYVGSFFGKEVLRFNGSTGVFIDIFAQVPLPDTDGQVGAVVFGPDGNLYVGLPNTGNDVVRFDGSGAFLGSFIPVMDTHPDGPLSVLFGPDGNLYVSARDSDQVLRYDGSSGAFLDVFASGGGLDEAAGLVFAPEPGPMLLLVTGALVLAAVRGRRASP